MMNHNNNHGNCRGRMGMRFEPGWSGCGNAVQRRGCRSPRTGEACPLFQTMQEHNNRGVYGCGREREERNNGGVCGCGREREESNNGGVCGCGREREERNNGGVWGCGREREERNNGGVCGCGREREERNNGACGDCHKLLQQIRAVDFALYEVVLYLDVYPTSCEALETYHKLVARYKDLCEQYERECGPLTMAGNLSHTAWDWINKPFPWENSAN